ncbi:MULTISPECIES: Zn-ribbon domain-containing OB-fold protein [Amycolatopsis]|uniref:Zn-ribbon domain-containing OB-fold protein n=1 Tax=Amycolatopsis TaxID=1813 RepID=UPI0004167AC8|nr:OB-fold domain-containing protein [Amycolatopsis thermoflava]
MTRPLADRDSTAWWEGLAEHRLLLQTCGACGRHRLVARPLCASCGSFAWRWTEASGEGTIASWVVSHRAYQPDRTAPYTVVMVRLAEGDDLLLPGGWTEGADLAVGLPVRATYQDLPGDPPAALLRWQPTGEST